MDRIDQYSCGLSKNTKIGSPVIEFGLMKDSPMLSCDDGFRCRWLL